ncbi:Metallo-dependent phosphatase [Basidiobolus meristosporus CBS 931.73]|uniref:Metallo-dependent phosphatase n=1 Tax=Basidiobolus meristosporus CBS 931.73 TaxID=1314790 RepID=A0A1Y1Y1G0_9FUNG|nr:Metallo-dependent phosphatase [Basidiobolus meristosporus CBS 931.73]|eukprot:ORX91843.1 Metallo-dependent phosphatase [Basidiobolus meristosporus CBS 931.73]
MALIADPQITDAYSYKQHGLVLRLVEFYTDIYMKRSYRILQSQLEPQVIFYLGDLFDGGREWDDDEVWFEELDRFNSVFSTLKPNTYLFSVAGNHDIGFGNSTVPHAYTRYAENFGKINYSVDIGNHSFVVLNTMALSNEGSKYAEEAQILMQSSQETHLPKILLSHVPLFRPDSASCGPLRNGPIPIRQKVGYQYQNLIEEDISNTVLNTVKPVLVLSGDDHDQCEHRHRFTEGTAVEHTIGTFSWAQGNSIPSFGLLSLHNPDGVNTQNPEATYSLDICFLPNQLTIYIVYILALVCSIIALLMHVIRTNKSKANSIYSTSKGSFSGLFREFASSLAEVAITSICIYILCILWFAF